MTKKKDNNEKTTFWPVEGSFEDEYTEDDYQDGGGWFVTLDDNLGPLNLDDEVKDEIPESTRSADAKPLAEALDMLRQIGDDIKLIQHRSNADSLTSPHFDDSNVIMSITMHDNDFSRVIHDFVKKLAPEIASKDIRRLSDYQKVIYFTEVWRRTCYALYYLNNVNSWHIAKWGDDLYDPRGYGLPERSKMYMIDRIKICFGEEARETFDEYGTDGNGEFFFVDSSGEIGSS